MEQDKDIRWVGSSYDDLRDFPAGPRRDAGFQLSKVQAGQEPEDWKPFDDVGAVGKGHVLASPGMERVERLARIAA